MRCMVPAGFRGKLAGLVGGDVRGWPFCSGDVDDVEGGCGVA